MSELTASEFADRVLGARLVAIEDNSDGTVTLDFEHRGTDDDSGRMRVALSSVEWDAESGAKGDET